MTKEEEPVVGKKRKLSDSQPVEGVKKEKYKKKPIPKAIREQVWITTFGRVFEHRCYIKWCTNVINCFDFEAAHKIAEVKGGSTSVDNLVPCCSRCNKSMSSMSIEEFDKMGQSKKKKWWKRLKWWD